MGARSLRMKLQKARVVQYELSSSISSPPLPTTSYIAYPPIFLSPSNFDALTPSPSPLPAAGSPQHEIPTAAIVGGGIAGVVALAATATIISTVAGKVGLSCLMGPLVKLLSCFGGNLFGPCSQRLNFLRDTLNKCNPVRRRRRRSNEEVDNNEGSADRDGDMLYEILGGSPTKESKDVECTAAAAYSLTTSPLRDVVEGHVERLQTSAHAYLVTTVSDFSESVESELRKTKEMMVQPLHQGITKAQGYADSFFSVADNVSDNLRYLDLSSDVVGGLKGNASYVRASMFKEEIEVGVEETSKGHKMASEKLQEEEEEAAVLRQKRGRPPITSTKRGTDELEEENLEQRVLLNGGGKSGQVCIVENGRNANTTELQVLEESTAGVPASRKQKTRGAASDATTHSMALVPTETGGTATIPTVAGTMVPATTKAMVPSVKGKTMISSSKGKRAGDDATTMGKGKRKRIANNLGHVSFSCEMSAHRLRFFASCRSGGTYGSPPASPDHSSSSTNNNKKYTTNNNSNNYNYYPDDSIIKVVYPTSSDQPSTAHNYQLYAPLYSAASHYNLMHQQLYHPSSSILVQHNTPLTQHVAPLSVAPLEAMDNKSPSHSSHKPLEIHDYGGPFDGVL